MSIYCHLIVMISPAPIITTVIILRTSKLDPRAALPRYPPAYGHWLGVSPALNGAGIGDLARLRSLPAHRDKFLTSMSSHSHDCRPLPTEPQSAPKPTETNPPGFWHHHYWHHRPSQRQSDFSIPPASLLQVRLPLLVVICRPPFFPILIY